MHHISQSLAKVQEQSLELQRQELPPPAIGEEKSFEVALQEPKINALQDVEPLKEALRLAMVMVGLRAQNYPADLEKTLLIGFIIENYGGHTCAEIKLAFTMAIGGKLGLETKDVTCYENFSILYFSSIMNAYREWAKQAFFHLPRKAVKQIEHKSDVTDDEFIESVKAVYNSNKRWQGIPVLAYEILCRQKKIELNSRQKNIIKNHVDAAFPELPEATRKEYYKAFSVMVFFEGKTIEE